MGECLMTRRGGSVSDDIIICGGKTLTCRITVWKESYGSVTTNIDSISVKKSNDSNGGAGFYPPWMIDVTDYRALEIDVEFTAIRNTTVTNYLPMIGLSTTKIAYLTNALSPRLLLVPASTSSLVRCKMQLDLTDVTGEYYINYKGIATGTIYDFRLTK